MFKHNRSVGLLFSKQFSYFDGDFDGDFVGDFDGDPVGDPVGAPVGDNDRLYFDMIYIVVGTDRTLVVLINLNNYNKYCLGISK